jgi:hypothetical protein
MRREKPTQKLLFEAVGIRGAIVGIVALLVAIAVVTFRATESTAPTDTVGLVPEQTTTTLLEFVPDTDPPDPTAEPTPPPNSLFGGDPCRSLVAEDFTLVIAGLGRGRLVDASPLSDDTCGFVVIVVGQEFNMSVQAIDATAFGRPPADDEIRIALADIGLAAYSVVLDAEYSVWVKVDNGYFVVIAPDEATAIHLARAAARRADNPAEEPPPTTLITSPATTTTVVTSTTGG